MQGVNIACSRSLPRRLLVIHGCLFFIGVHDCYRNFVLIQKVAKPDRRELMNTIEEQIIDE